MGGDEAEWDEAEEGGARDDSAEIGEGGVERYMCRRMTPPIAGRRGEGVWSGTWAGRGTRRKSSVTRRMTETNGGRRDHSLTAVRGNAGRSRPSGR
jgi:hypothetical protein